MAGSNFILAELSVQAQPEMHWWVGRATHHLRRVAGVLRMSFKKVVLINAAEPLPNRVPTATAAPDDTASTAARPAVPFDPPSAGLATTRHRVPS